MPSIDLDIDHDFDDGLVFAKRIDDEIDSRKKNISQVVAGMWKRNAQRVMQKHGNVVTGTGIRSMRVRQKNPRTATVTGADYLQDLETGTGPHYPDTNNYRFIAAAKSYGMSTQQLAEVIAKKGTRKHEWMNETTQITRKSARNKARLEVRSAARDALKKMF